MSGVFFVFFHSLLRRYVFFSISALGTALSLPFPKKSPSCRMWYCRFTVCNDCDPRRAAPACTRSRSGTLGSLAGMSGAGLGIPPAWAGLPWDTGVHPCHGLFCVKCHMSAGERKNQRESRLDPLALQNECYQLKEFQFVECLWGGCGTGQCHLGIHPRPCTAGWGTQGRSQCSALLLRPHIPPRQMLTEEPFVALQTSLRGDCVGGTAAVKLLSWQKASGGDEAMELNSSFISKLHFSLCWCFVEALSLFDGFSSFQWVWGRSHSFPIQYTEHSALS